MAASFFLDASALTKRYLTENGSPNINHLFQSVAANRLACLDLGTLEVISVLVRAHNRGTITTAQYQQGMLELRNEIIDNKSVVRLEATPVLVAAAGVWIPKHSINATDALALACVLDYEGQLQQNQQSLVLVSSDQRLLRAAQAERITTYNPETQTIDELNFFIVMFP